VALELLVSADEDDVVREHTSVLGFEQTESRVASVITDADRIGCDQVVPATGCGLVCSPRSWARRCRSARGREGYSVDYFPSPVPPRTPLTFEDAHVAVTPLNGRLRLAGTMEFAGCDADIDTHRIAVVKRAAAYGFGEWDEDTPARRAVGGSEPDDRRRAADRRAAATGEQRAGGVRAWQAGLTLASSIAKTVRDLARDVSSGRRSPLMPYGPERFLKSSQRSRG
jgi:D-amino-acid dehydrogenase